MRRLLVALMTAALACSVQAQNQAATSAPAVVSTWSGYIDTGFTYTFGNGTDSFIAHGYDTGTLGRLDLNGSLAYGDCGMKVRLRAQPFYTDQGLSSLSVRRAFAYYRLFGGKLEIDGGILGLGAYYTPYNGLGVGDNPNRGVAIQVKPVSGLSLAYFIPAGTTGDTLANTFKKSSAAAYWSIPKFADFLAVCNYVGIAAPQIVASVSLTAIDHLTASIEFANDSAWSNLELGQDVGVTGNGNELTEYVTYSSGKWYFDVVANQNFGASDFSWDVNPGCSYKIAKGISGGMDLGYLSSRQNVYADGWAYFTLGKNRLEVLGAYYAWNQKCKATVSLVSSF